MVIVHSVVRCLFASDDGEPVCEAEGNAGDRLLDLCDAVAAPVPFSCRDASCGTCLVRVLEGAALLAPPNLHEARLLVRLGGGPDARLACQARIARGDGVLRIAPAG
jgi:ferredoxin